MPLCLYKRKEQLTALAETHLVLQLLNKPVSPLHFMHSVIAAINASVPEYVHLLWNTALAKEKTAVVLVH